MLTNTIHTTNSIPIRNTQIPKPKTHSIPKPTKAISLAKMATTNRLLRATRHVGPPTSTCSSSQRCFNNLSSDNKVANHLINNANGGISSVRTSKQVAAASDRYLIPADPFTGSVGRGLEIIAGVVSGLVRSVRNSLVAVLERPPVKLKPRKFNVQLLIERAIVDCRFFTLFAVAGSLLGSILCFLEGCHFVLESYLHYFKSLTQTSDQGHHLMQLIMEAIDMFMVGTALLIFGVGIYVMFVGTNDSREEELRLPGSNLFGFFDNKSIPRWANMQSVTQAKSKIGHALLMILQVGLLDKMKNIPIVTCLDLACFGATILITSACIFLLSRLSGERTR